MKKSLASSVFMVAPTSFGFDEQTAASNTFQHHLQLPSSQIQRKAQAEFDEFVARLRQHDITVVAFQEAADEQPKPNAVFPNNWFTTWPDGRVFLYPMATPSRRAERSPEAVTALRNSGAVASIADLSAHEAEDVFLEGTGAMVFDHAHLYAYGCLSARCNEALFTAHVRELGYKPIVFHAYDATGMPIYHTNVVLAVLSTAAVLCSEAITDATERARVVESLAKTGHTLIDITQDQLNHFCANVLEVQNSAGDAFLILSQTAYDAFTSRQRTQLSQGRTLLPMDIPTIETVGGGSARCMVAELFLPRQQVD